MRITLDELRKRNSIVVDQLEIVSLEGQQYMARLTLAGRTLLLSDKHGNTILYRSAWQVQDTLGEFAVRETFIVHPSAYHEMVGMEPSKVEPMKIRVQRQEA